MKILYLCWQTNSPKSFLFCIYYKNLCQFCKERFFATTTEKCTFANVTYISDWHHFYSILLYLAMWNEKTTLCSLGKKESGGPGGRQAMENRGCESNNQVAGWRPANDGRPRVLRGRSANTANSTSSLHILTHTIRPQSFHSTTQLTMLCPVVTASVVTMIWSSEQHRFVCILRFFECGESNSGFVWVVREQSHNCPMGFCEK